MVAECKHYWSPSYVRYVPRDPRWGRNAEGGVEDPRLAGAYGAAWTRGLQRGPNGTLQAVVTLKHFDAQTVEDSNGYIRFNVSEGLQWDKHVTCNRRIHHLLLRPVGCTSAICTLDYRICTICTLDYRMYI
jgi:hypothetical protein